MPIAVAQSLVPTTAQAPLDARTVVAAVADIANIENPYVGLEVFVTATGKKYRIKTLTSTTVGTKTVYVVGTYEAIPDQSDISSAAAASDLTTLAGRVTTLESGATSIVLGAYQDVTTVSSGNVATFANSAIPVGIKAPSGKYYSLEKESLTINTAAGTSTLDFSAYLAYENSPTFTGTWRVYFACGPEGPTGRVSALSSTTITPRPYGVFSKTLAANDSFTIDTSVLDANKPLTFRLILTQPATAVSFTLPSSILWPGDDDDIRPYGYYPVFKSTNQPPAMSVGGREYTIVIHWNGSVLRGNLEYATEITAQ